MHPGRERTSTRRRTRARSRRRTGRRRARRRSRSPPSARSPGRAASDKRCASRGRSRRRPGRGAARRSRASPRRTRCRSGPRAPWLRSVFASERVTRSSAGKSTMRGSGLHHRIGSPSEYHGKMPRRYASSSRWGERSPPTARRPFGSFCAAASGGNGVSAPSQAITASALHLLPAVALELVHDAGAFDRGLRFAAVFEPKPEFVFGENAPNTSPPGCRPRTARRRWRRSRAGSPRAVAGRARRRPGRRPTGRTGCAPSSNG